MKANGRTNINPKKLGENEYGNTISKYTYIYK